MLSISFSYWDLLKCPYFADTTERGDRGWKEAQRQGYFTDNSIVTLWLFSLKYGNFGAFLSQKSPLYPLHMILFICNAKFSQKKTLVMTTYQYCMTNSNGQSNNKTTSLPLHLVCRVKAWGPGHYRNKDRMRQ
jgi:hypothetical protein